MRTGVDSITLPLRARSVLFMLVSTSPLWAFESQPALSPCSRSEVLAPLTRSRNVQTNGILSLTMILMQSHRQPPPPASDAITEFSQRAIRVYRILGQLTLPTLSNTAKRRCLSTCTWANGIYQGMRRGAREYHRRAEACYLRVLEPFAATQLEGALARL